MFPNEHNNSVEAKPASPPSQHHYSSDAKVSLCHTGREKAAVILSIALLGCWEKSFWWFGGAGVGGEGWKTSFNTVPLAFPLSNKQDSSTYSLLSLRLRHSIRNFFLAYYSHLLPFSFLRRTAKQHGAEYGFLCKAILNIFGTHLLDKCQN